jgi:hypothetical protein
MFLRSPPQAKGRRGVILLVVLALLTLFAILGLSFVFYADAEATSARIYREAQSLPPDPTDVTVYWKNFLGQLIYDVPDPAPQNNTTVWAGNSPQSTSLRGHSLARNMYGWNDNNGPLPVAINQGPPPLNDKPYCGTGRIAEAITFTSGAAGAQSMTGQTMLNPMYFSTDTSTTTNQPFWRDPGRLGMRQYNTAVTSRSPITGDLNPPYTYPDHNNLYLAMVDPSSGQVLAPSYHRPWIFGQNLAAPPVPNPAAATNAWTSATGKYLTLRPRPAENDVTFQFPSDPFGDVKNIDWAPGGNDSIWVDIGIAPFLAPDNSGTMLKVMVAPLIIDLDGRINVNTAGNIMAQVPNGSPQGMGTLHASDQGWGPWEVSLAQAMNCPQAANEFANLFKGFNQTQGKYGPGMLPLGQGVPAGTFVHSYYPMDYNGVRDSAPWPLPTAQAGQAWALPGGNAFAVGYQLFPFYPSTFYGNANPVETPNHASQYNPMRPATGNLSFGPAETAALVRRGSVDGDALVSSLMTLAPQNLVGFGTATAQYTGSTSVDPAAMQRRARLTATSFDLDRPGTIPYLWTTGNYSYTQYTVQPGTAKTAMNAATAPVVTPGGGYAQGGGGVGFQDPTANRVSAGPPAKLNGQGEYDPVTWKSTLAAVLSRVNLGRALTNYPALGANPALPNQIDPNSGQYQQAVQDRQQMAAEIYNVLWRVTGCVNPATLNPATVMAQMGQKPTPPQVLQFYALQYLAQIAVNIVDFVDVDDFNTPFPWMQSTNKNQTLTYNANAATPQYVFGTEMPRVVINEYYAQWDKNVVVNKNKRQVDPTGKTQVNFWVELFNGFAGNDNADIVPNGTAPGSAVLYDPVSKIKAYQLLVCTGPNTPPGPPANGTSVNPSQGIRGLNNPTGTPNSAGPAVDWGTITQGGPTVIGPNYQQNPPNPNNKPQVTWKGNTNGSNGFYVLGPTTSYAAPIAAENPRLPTSATHANMSYTLSKGQDPTGPLSATQPPNGGQPSLVLQRLANPYLPAQPNSAAANYNPYITVDYVATVQVQNAQAGGVTNLNAYGRVQPFAADSTYNPVTGVYGQWQPQKPNPKLGNQPQNTFFRHNSTSANAPNGPIANDTLQQPFDVLYQPNRAMAGIGDLLHVSQYRPHELTQQFVDASGNHFGHRTRWTDPNTLLLRAWEFFTIGQRYNGPAVGGRIPGRVNINTTWDMQVLMALADPQNANLFTQSDVQNVWATLLNQRSPDTTTLSTSGSANGPGAKSVPFLGYGTGLSPSPANDKLALAYQTTTARGVNSSPLASGTATSTAWDGSQLRLLEPSSANAAKVQPATAQPLRRFELFSKMNSNFTTRSNTFAVWATFGFFVVTNSTTTPVQMGSEYVWPQYATPIRHKLFAIIDRTQLQVWPTTDPVTKQTMVKSGMAVTVAASPVPPTAPPKQDGKTKIATFAANQLVTLVDQTGKNIQWRANKAARNPLVNPYTGYNWYPQAGAIVTFDPDTDNEETVVLQALNANNPNQLYATFYKSHTQGCPVISRGNPGPWTNRLYDPALDTAVVSYSAQIN